MEKEMRSPQLSMRDIEGQNEQELMFDKQDASLFNEGSFSPNIVDKNPHSAFIRNQIYENRTNDNTLMEGNCDANQTTLTNVAH